MEPTWKGAAALLLLVDAVIFAAMGHLAVAAVSGLILLVLWVAS